MENVKQKQRIQNPLNAPIAHLAQRYGGEKPKELERFLRFAVVGVVGAIVDFSVLIGLQSTILPPTNSIGDPLKFNATLATTIAFLIAVVSNFIWTTLWVYPDSRTRSKRKQLALFTFISVIGGTIRSIWVGQTFHGMGNLIMPLILPLIQLVAAGFTATPRASDQFGSIATQMIAMVVVMLWNFFANRHWTYNDVD